MARAGHLLGWSLILLLAGGGGAVCGALLDDVTVIAPSLVFLLVVAIAFIASRASVYAWIVALSLLAMPLDARAMFRRVMLLMSEFFAYFLAIVTCAATGFAIGAKLSIVTCIAIAWLAFAAATAIGLILTLYPTIIPLLHLAWIAIASLSFWSGVVRTFHFLHDLGWRISPIAGGALLLLVTPVALATLHALLPLRYTPDAILRKLERGRPLEPKGDVSEANDAISRALRARSSERTYALLQLATRRTDPEAVALRIRGMAIALAIAMMLAWVIRIAFDSDRGFIAPVVVFVIAANVVVIRAFQTPRVVWKHPLIETLPVAAREFASLLVVRNLIISAVLVLLAITAGWASPWRWPWLVIGAVLLFFCGIVSVSSPINQSAVYRVDPRRTRWSAFVHSCRDAGSLCAMLLSMVIPPLLFWLWRRTWRIDAQHRFDCEYKATTSYATRW